MARRRAREGGTFWWVGTWLQNFRRILTRDWLCRSELMKRPTPVESSEILNFWNFAVRRVYMPTGLPPTHPRFCARVHVPWLRKFFHRISPITISIPPVSAQLFNMLVLVRNMARIKAVRLISDFHCCQIVKIRSVVNSK